MRLILITLTALLLATVVGLGATWMTTTRGTEIGALTIGSSALLAAVHGQPLTGLGDLTAMATRGILVAAILGAPVSPETRRLAAERDAARR